MWHCVWRSDWHTVDQDGNQSIGRLQLLRGHMMGVVLRQFELIYILFISISTINGQWFFRVCIFARYDNEGRVVQLMNVSLPFLASRRVLRLWKKSLFGLCRVRIKNIPRYVLRLSISHTKQNKNILFFSFKHKRV